MMDFKLSRKTDLACFEIGQHNNIMEDFLIYGEQDSSLTTLFEPTLKAIQTPKAMLEWLGVIYNAQMYRKSDLGISTLVHKLHKQVIEGCSLSVLEETQRRCQHLFQNTKKGKTELHFSEIEEAMTMITQMIEKHRLDQLVQSHQANTRTSKPFKPSRL